MAETVPPVVGPDPSASGFRLLDDRKLETIHRASLEVLEKTGTRVLEPEAVEMLGDAGCTVTDDTLVRFPERVVEDALEAAPSTVELWHRDGSRALHLEEHRTYFGTGSDLPNVLDLDSGDRRLARLEDVGDAARLVDAMPRIDFTMSMALPSDLRPETSDRWSFLEMVKNTTKPIVFTAWDEHGLEDILQMAECVAGGPDALRAHPFVLPYLEPTSPLQHSGVVIRKMLRMADRRLPILYAPGGLMGASVPMTDAGSLALGNAEVLSGLVIAQLRSPGLPVVYGIGNGPLDLRTMVAIYSGPETLRSAMASAELARVRYGLPVWGFAGCSDSKRPDMQAGIEAALWILWTALAGANLVHDVGYLESGLTCSHETIVGSDETIEFVRRLLAPFDVDDEGLALDLIHEVGPAGNFMGTFHTRDHCTDTWMPRLFDRGSHRTWTDAGARPFDQAAREYARETIANHRPVPLATDVLETIEEIARESDASASSNGP